MIPIKAHAHKDGVVLAVARTLGVTVDDLTCKSREAWRVLIRYGIAYSLRCDHNWSWESISETINRERTTCYYAVETADLLINKGTHEQRAILNKVRDSVTTHLDNVPHPKV